MCCVCPGCRLVQECKHVRAFGEGGCHCYDKLKSARTVGRLQKSFLLRHTAIVSCVSLSQPTFICFQWPDKFEWAAAVNPKSFLKTWLNSAEHASHCNYTSFLGGLHEEVHCIPSNYKTFLGGCPRRNCPSAHALASHQKLFSWATIKGVKTIKCYGPWKCLTSRYTQTVPKTTWQQSSNMKCLKSFKIDLKVDFDSEKINPAILCAISSCWEVFATKKLNFSQNDGLLLEARMDEAA